MTIETIRMSSKGQIVIPQDLREQMDASEGTLFGVVRSRDTLILKKIDTPSRESLILELEGIAKEGRKRLEKRGIKESDFNDIVQRSRRK